MRNTCPSRLQISCQYQVAALCMGANPAIVFSEAYVQKCLELEAKKASPIPRRFPSGLDSETRSDSPYEPPEKGQRSSRKARRAEESFASQMDRFRLY